MVIKLDMANVFDKVRHSFLFKVMKKMGFHDQFIQWVALCTGSPWIAHFINERGTRFFKASKDLW